MKWKSIILIACTLLLISCGVKEEDQQSNVSYTHDEPLTHEMEQVLVEMTYLVVDHENFEKNYGNMGLEDETVIVLGNVSITNQREEEIFYTPSFVATTEKGEKYENIAIDLGLVETEEQLKLSSTEKYEFPIAFVMPLSTYENIDVLDIIVPVPYLEPNSVISSDALGDTTVWKIKIK